MGSTTSSALGPLAVDAVAEITRFELNHVRALQQLFAQVVHPSESPCESEHPTEDTTTGTDDAHHDHSHQPLDSHRHEPNLSHAQFHDALARADFFDSDVAIFDRMFTLLDRTGDEAIAANEFLVSICALLRGDLASKLHAACEVVHETPQSISRDALEFVLHTLAQAASYFGDPAVATKTTRSIADDVFATEAAAVVVMSAPALSASDSKQAGDEVGGDEHAAAREPHKSGACASLSTSDVVARVVQHPVVQEYVHGHPTTTTAAVAHHHDS